ncbi:MAG: flagellar motor switch protein FliN [Planctomycetes bacterium]|nr:flagellar motor switch protein FliN [Planctomycetota bacterium]
MDENNGVDVDQEKASSEEKLQNEENASEEQAPDAVASDEPAADSSSPEENVSDGEAQGDAGGESTPDEGSADVNEDEQAALLNQEDVVDESAADAADAGGEGEADAEPEAGDGGMLSQDEIDAALQQGGGEADSGDASDDAGSEDAGDDDGGMSQEEIDAAINDAVGELEGNDLTSTEQQPDVQEADFQQLSSSNKGEGQRNIDLLMDVELPVSIELGKTTMDISDILALGPGSVVELEKLVGEPVDLLVNNKCVARGEVVVVEENFGLRITSLISPEERIKNLQ